MTQIIQLGVSQVLLDDGTTRGWCIYRSEANGYTTVSSECGNISPPIKSFKNKKIIKIASNTKYTLALLDDGTIRTWGQKDIIGREHNQHILPEISFGNNIVIDIAAGRYQAIVLLDDMTIRCWGLDGYPPKGFNLPEYKVFYKPGLSNYVIGSKLKVLQIGGGEKYFSALLEDNSIRSWEGTYNLLRYIPPYISNEKQIINMVCENEHMIVLFDDGTAQCYGTNEYGEAPPGEIKFHSRIIKILGCNGILYHGRVSGALLEDNTIMLWGKLNIGRGIIPSIIDRPDKENIKDIYIYKNFEDSIILVILYRNNTLMCIDLYNNQREIIVRLDGFTNNVVESSIEYINRIKERL
jgi:hypothetical protein